MLDCACVCMHPELEKLVHLQHTEQRILALSGEIAACPKRVKEREMALVAAERELAAATQSIAAEEKNRRGMESTVEDLRRKAARYRVQMDAAQNESQVQALQHEIDFSEQEASRLEDAAIESMMRIEALEQQQRLAQTTVEHRRQQLADEKAETEKIIQRDSAERSALQQQCLEIRATIEEGMLSIYDRLASSRKTAVAEAADQRCSACQMMVRPQKWNELQNAAILYCDSCGRLLYFSALVDLSQEIARPVQKSTDA